MNRFFFIAAVISIVFGVISENLSSVSSAVLKGSSDAAALLLKLLGSLCFWSGIMNVAEKSGLVKLICRLLRPLILLIFPGLEHEEKALGAVSMNLSANLLGIGNAATPFGIEAVNELKTLSKSDFATKEMVCFVVMNTASLQLIPTTIAALRMENGVENPLDILPAVWFVSIFSLVLGIFAAKVFYPRCEKT